MICFKYNGHKVTLKLVLQLGDMFQVQWPESNIETSCTTGDIYQVQLANTEVTFQMQLVCNMVMSLPSGMHPQVESINWL